LCNIEIEIKKEKTMDEPEKLDLRSHDLSEGRKDELLRLFPEIRTESGKIDLERLILALGKTVDIGKERYGMNWPGKADCFKAIQSPSLGTLRPCPEESVNFDTTENLIIEGDNLEVLKLLQKSYLGKIKMIYIDPPYNTGNDFIYPDNYTESLQTYLEFTGQADAKGKKFSTNTEADGRFHSNWLDMMYPRLYLARNLLREDGIIFASIDDHEVDNLKKVCIELFGEENFVAQMVWRSRLGKGGTSEQVAFIHEYIMVFARNIEAVFMRKEERVSGGSRERLRQWGQGDRRVDRPSMFYPIYTPKGEEVLPIKPDGTEGRWRVGRGKMQELIQSGFVEFELRDDGKFEAYKIIPSGHKTYSAYDSILTADCGTTAEGSKEVKEIFGEQVMDYPKPVALLNHILNLADANDSDLILDFFAGSGTTAQAVLELNKKEGSNLKFILVQLPEPTDREDYPTIVDICKERVRRVIKKLNDSTEGKLPLERTQKQDRGFRVFKFAESNFKAWNANVPTGDVAALRQQLELHVEHIREHRTHEDILYEILLKSGFPLTTAVEKLSIEDKTVFSAAGGALFICLERNLTLELIRAIADKKPERVVCLDEGFAGNDQLKANAVQIFKTKGVTSFKTV
jgi:adenine-specific DNA-methyltransferase